MNFVQDDVGALLRRVECRIVEVDGEAVMSRTGGAPRFSVRVDGEEYTPTRVVGKGTFGTVVRYVKADRPPICVKSVYAGDDGAVRSFFRDRLDLEEARAAKAFSRLRPSGVIGAMLAVEASRLGRRPGRRDPLAWSAVVMEAANGNASEFRDQLTAASAAELVLSVAAAVKELLQLGYVYVDNKLENILYVRRKRSEVSIRLGDLGGVLAAGHRVDVAPTFPPPWMDRDACACSRELAAWGCAALFVQLFGARLLPGEVKPAWSFLTYDAATTSPRGGMWLRDNLRTLIDKLRGARLGDDEDAARVRDAVLDLMSPDMDRISIEEVTTQCSLMLLTAEPEEGRRRKKRRFSQ